MPVNQVAKKYENLRHNNRYNPRRNIWLPVLYTTIWASLAHFRDNSDTRLLSLSCIRDKWELKQEKVEVDNTNVTTSQHVTKILTCTGMNMYISRGVNPRADQL